MESEDLGSAPKPATTESRAKKAVTGENPRNLGTMTLGRNTANESAQSFWAAQRETEESDAGETSAEETEVRIEAKPSYIDRLIEH